MHEPLPFPELVQQKHKGVTTNNYTSYGKLFQLFKSKYELKLKLGFESITKGFQYKVRKSTKDTVEVVCFVENYDYRIWATKDKNTNKFQVTHTCLNMQLCLHHRQANKNVLGHLLKGILVDSTGNMLQGKKIQRTLNDRLSGPMKKAFKTFILLQLGEEELWEEFQTSLHTIIIIYGAHLKGKYLGIMFQPLYMDGNNQILTIAFGTGKTKSEESLILFLSRHKECIGDMPSLAIISNIVNSIEITIQALFPNAYHVLCCSNLLMNMRTKIGKQERMEILFWESDFKESLARLRRALNEDCRTWLDRIGYEKWERSCFPMLRYNIMTSNNAKSVNALSRDAQKLPQLFNNRDISDVMLELKPKKILLSMLRRSTWNIIVAHVGNDNYQLYLILVLWWYSRNLDINTIVHECHHTSQWKHINQNSDDHEMITVSHPKENVRFRKNAVVAKGLLTLAETVTLSFPHIQQKLNL
uniref:MULE transposase domain-containing protein n=1 Tax=Lactuca sativa TaxID=4236 RepID=A0A9R1W3Q3_LACSA|nr:hypothetical protein LSAT_V11C300121010 [Lactuca sativa]